MLHILQCLHSTEVKGYLQPDTLEWRVQSGRPPPWFSHTHTHTHTHTSKTSMHVWQAYVQTRLELWTRLSMHSADFIHLHGGKQAIDVCK